jgi:homeobox protein ESX1
MLMFRIYSVVFFSFLFKLYSLSLPPMSPIPPMPPIPPIPPMLLIPPKPPLTPYHPPHLLYYLLPPTSYLRHVIPLIEGEKTNRQIKSEWTRKGKT